MNYSTSFERMLDSFYRQDKCRISRLLTKCDALLTTEFCDYITTRGEMLSYLPAGKEHKVNDDGKWSREGRQEARPAKLVRKLILPSIITDFEISDKEFEMFANNVKAYVMSNGDGDNDKNEIVKIAVCNGDFIEHYYDADNYAPGQPENNLLSSCMRDMSDGTFDIYTKNTDVVSMVVALSFDNLVLGRALLWKTKEKGWCMDTTYGQDKIKKMLVNWARANNVHYKSQQSCHWHDFDMLDGELISPWEATVRLKYSDFSSYPYVDTMYNLCVDTNCVSNREFSGEYRTLRCTGGGYEGQNETVYDDWTGDDIPEDEARHIDYRLPNGDRFCGYTHTDNICDVSHYGYVLQDHAIYSHDLREWIVSDSVYWIYSERDQRWYDADDCVTTYDGDVIDYDDSVCLENGEYAHYDDAVETDGGVWHLEKDCVEVDGKWILKSNIDNQ